MNKYKLLIILSFTLIIFNINSCNDVQAACVDLDGDGTAETCIGGGGYSVPNVSKPTPVKSDSTTETTSSSKNSHKSSSSWKNFNDTSNMVDEVIHSIQQQSLKKKINQQNQIINEQQRAIEEMKKKEQEEKRKAEEAKRQAELAKKREATKKWINQLENKDTTPGQKDNNELSGKIKLLRDPDKYTNPSLTDPQSDIRVSDLEHIKIKNINKPVRTNNQPVYYGPDPKNLNNQGLQHQINLMDSQIAGCEKGTPHKCSPEFFNMLIKEKEKYVCEIMSRGQTPETIQTSLSSKLKPVEPVTSGINSQSANITTKNTSATKKTSINKQFNRK